MVLSQKIPCNKHRRSCTHYGIPTTGHAHPTHDVAGFFSVLFCSLFQFSRRNLLHVLEQLCFTWFSRNLLHVLLEPATPPPSARSPACFGTTVFHQIISARRNLLHVLPLEQELAILLHVLKQYVPPSSPARGSKLTLLAKLRRIRHDADRRTMGLPGPTDTTIISCGVSSERSPPVSAREMTTREKLSNICETSDDRYDPDERWSQFTPSGVGEEVATLLHAD